MDSGKGAPMACCLIYWGNDKKGFFNNFIEYGAVVYISYLKKKKIGQETYYSFDLFNNVATVV